MKSVKMVASLLLVVTVFTSQAMAGFAMAVPDFKVNGLPFHLGPAVSEVIRTELATVPGLDLVVMNASHVRKATGEQRLGMSGLVDPETAAKVGKLVGARYVLVGSLNSLGGEITIESRLVDVETGVVLESFSSSSDNGQEGLITAARLLTDDVKQVLVGDS